MTNLIEFQNIKQLEQLPVLLAVLQLDVMLTQPVKRQFGLVIDVNLHRLENGWGMRARDVQVWGGEDGKGV